MPVNILSDVNQHKPVAGFETLRQAEELHAEDSGVKATQHFGVNKHEEESSVLSKVHNKSGKFNVGVRDEYVQEALSLTDDFYSKPTAAQNDQKPVEFTHEAQQSSSEGNSKTNDEKLNQHFSESQNKQTSKKKMANRMEK